jgi:AraC-like DNA-binding protein
MRKCVMLDNEALSADPVVHDERVTRCKLSTFAPSEATRSRTPTAADFAAVRFSTWDWPERERLPRWREEFGRGMVSVDVEPVGSDLPFYAEATLQALPGVRTAFCAGSPARMNRTRALAADADDSIWLVVNLGPKATVSQRGDDIALDLGDAIPMFTDDAGILTSTDHLGIVLRRAALALRVGDLDRAMLRVIPRSLEPLRLLLSYLDLIRREAALAMPALRQSVVDHIHDLAALTLGAHCDTRESGLSAIVQARLASALADIAENFSVPGLTLDAVARRLGVSRRYLQRLLEEAGTSFTGRVTELRLQRAYALLTAPDGRRRRISDIALESGFSDVSHFNSRFRARFGDTPSGVRGDGLTPSI